MSCTEVVCGTGGWTGPLPGDPDNNVLLTANRVFGGIDVSWTYPTTNPYAVAHTLLYRGITNEFLNAAQRAVVAGSIFYDKIDVETETQYYYWIQVVSVNGSVGETIGPVSAIALPIGVQTLEQLTDRIDEGVLSQSLRASIANITVIGQDLLKEVQDRLASNLALQAALSAVQSETGEALTYVLNEVTERITADSAMVSSINAISAGLNDNAAAMVEERTVRVTKDESLAQSISTLYSEFNTSVAAIINTQTTQANAQSALSQSIAENYAEFEANRAVVSNTVTALTNADSALASNVQTLFSEIGAASAAIHAERSTRVSENQVLTQQVTAANSTLYGNTASGEVGLKNEITTLNGKVTGIGSLYTVKSNVNGLIGGFGTYNDGNTVQAGWDVDSFWVGRPNEGGVRPFMIDQGTVYINKARIRDADIGTLKIAGNAVTVPFAGGGAMGYGGTVSTSAQWLEAGSTVIAIATFTVAHGGLKTASGSMNICGAGFASTNFTFENYGNGTLAGIGTVGSAGWYTVSLSVSGEGGGTCTGSFISAFGGKR